VRLTSGHHARQHLRDIREQRGIRRRELAAQLHIVYRTLAGRELGEAATSIGDFIDQAAALGLAVHVVPATIADDSIDEASPPQRLSAADFAAEYDHLRDYGYSRAEIALRLGMTRDAADQAYRRAVHAGLLTPDRRAS
jgi:transcriptional regulator with XRE-family HTH domain